MGEAVFRQCQLESDADRPVYRRVHDPGHDHRTSHEHDRTTDRTSVGPARDGPLLQRPLLS